MPPAPPFSPHSRPPLLHLTALLTLLGCSAAPTPATDAGTNPQDAGTSTPSDAGPGADAGCPTSIPPRPGTVLTGHGAVTGVLTGTVYAFKGLPYAAPPIGALRWKPPSSPGCWSGERAANSYGAVCPQLETDGGFVGDEDCLTLNLWARSSPPPSPAPVLFFIHGGGNTIGASSEPFYDGQFLADRTGALVVTVNYRLGPLGFFAHSSLDQENDAGVSGNYGIRDLVAALGWVQRNAAAFGGDPSRVLIFGESAGAVNTLVLLASPLAKGLFSAALVESGGWTPETLAQIEQEQLQVVQAVGCSAAGDVAACMRAVSAKQLALVPRGLGPLTAGLHYSPAIDGQVLLASVYETIAQGKHNRVPLILGTNADETSRMVANVTSEAEYKVAIATIFGASSSAKVLARYPSGAFGTPRKTLIRVTTDAIWTCPSRKLLRILAAQQTEPVFRYFFTYSPPGISGTLYGATHGLELPFVFGTFSASPGFVPGAGELALSGAVGKYWYRLAEVGDPNSPGSTPWPLYQAAADPYLQLDTTLAAGQGLRTADCDFWDSL